MNKPHKWAEVIKAWADGKTVQWRRNWGLSPTEWVDWDPKTGPSLDSAVIFRIKPELKTPGQVCRSAWYKAVHTRVAVTLEDTPEWEAAAKAVIEAYKAGELKDF